eukprot:TRINITY_DN1683_c1_g1_i1.p1 TRINITY_DN1683_c1_g1~~TRINITY_DN1683_c1_g1_i1.p1  ORF type:complete len:335 (-),score=104.23 TRINITY_DN1683_c1_g1_i1:91-1050(-)
MLNHKRRFNEINDNLFSIQNEQQIYNNNNNTNSNNNNTNKLVTIEELNLQGIFFNHENENIEAKKISARGRRNVPRYRARGPLLLIIKLVNFLSQNLNKSNKSNKSIHFSTIFNEKITLLVAIEHLKYLSNLIIKRIRARGSDNFCDPIYRWFFIAELILLTLNFKLLLSLLPEQCNILLQNLLNAFDIPITTTITTSMNLINNSNHSLELSIKLPITIDNNPTYNHLPLIEKLIYQLEKYLSNLNFDDSQTISFYFNKQHVITIKAIHSWSYCRLKDLQLLGEKSVSTYSRRLNKLLSCDKQQIKTRKSTQRNKKKLI